MENVVCWLISRVEGFCYSCRQKKKTVILHCVSHKRLEIENAINYLARIFAPQNSYSVSLFDSYRFFKGSFQLLLRQRLNLYSMMYSTRQIKCFLLFILTWCRGRKVKRWRIALSSVGIFAAFMKPQHTESTQTYRKEKTYQISNSLFFWDSWYRFGDVADLKSGWWHNFVFTNLISTINLTWWNNIFTCITWQLKTTTRIQLFLLWKSIHLVS